MRRRSGGPLRPARRAVRRVRGPRPPRRPSPAATRRRRSERARDVGASRRLEEEALEWIDGGRSAPRGARGATAPDEVLEKIGMMAVLAEDTTRDHPRDGRSISSPSARGRARSTEAAKVVAAFRSPLPEAGPARRARWRGRGSSGSCSSASRRGERARRTTRRSSATPRGSSSAASWRRGRLRRRRRTCQDATRGSRKHLLEIRDSLREPAPAHRAARSRRGALPARAPARADASTRGRPRRSRSCAWRSTRTCARRRAAARRSASRPAAKVHLGLALDVAALPARLERLEARLRELAVQALEASAGADARRGIEARARELLWSERPCPRWPTRAVRAMAPPPERAAVCGALRALTEEARPRAALVALHDDVLLSLAAVVRAPPAAHRAALAPARTTTSTRSSGWRASAPSSRSARPSPRSSSTAPRDRDDRIAAWRALGEAPLDVVARERRSPRSPSASSAGARRQPLLDQHVGDLVRRRVELLAPRRRCRRSCRRSSSSWRAPSPRRSRRPPARR